MGDDDLILDAIRAAFDDMAASTSVLSGHLARLNAELRRLEALSGHDEYVIPEEPEIFD